MLSSSSLQQIKKYLDMQDTDEECLPLLQRSQTSRNELYLSVFWQHCMCQLPMQQLRRCSVVAQLLCNHEWQNSIF